MAADLSHLISVDAKKHKYEETVKDVSSDLKDIGTDVYGTEG